jgi:hypothetical protein
MDARRTGKALLILAVVLGATYGATKLNSGSGQPTKMPNVIPASQPQRPATALVLANSPLGPLGLDADTELSLEKLKSVFAGLTVERKVGEQDGPDFVYFEISDQTGELFWIKAQDDDPGKIDSVHVTSDKVVDQYGLRIGSTYAQIHAARPALLVETDEHFHTYVGDPEEEIVYELSCPYAAGYEGPDRNPTETEIRNGVIEKLVWFPRLKTAM